MRRGTKIIYGVVVVFVLMVGWIFSGWPQMQHDLFFLFRTEPARAAQATIDSAVSTTATTHLGGSPTTVFTSTSVGYSFYVDSTGYCAYSKTINGGSTWGVAVNVSGTTCIQVAVWYDRWTPGDTTGNLIHVAMIDTTNDDIFYRYLDTSNGTLSTGPVNITSGLGYAGSLGAGTNHVTFTKGTDGALYAAVSDATDNMMVRCTTTCTVATNWAVSEPASWTAGNDFQLLVPRLSGQILFLWWDISVTTNDIKYATWNGSSWSGFGNVATALDNTTYDASWGATVDPTTGDVYLAYANSAATLGTDDDVMVKKFNGSWSNLSDVVTNSVCAGGSECGITGVKIARDNSNGDLYVLYTAQATAGTASTGNVYYKMSTNNGSVWSGEFGPLYSTSDDIYGGNLSLSDSSGIVKMYATWYAITPDDLFGDMIAPMPPGVSGSVGKSSDGWSGAIPVTLTLVGGLNNGTYPYARAKVDTPAGQTFYVPMAWNSTSDRFEGTIYPGSNYCNGCADPTTGSFAVTLQLDNNSDFSSVDYTDSGSFSTFITRRWNAISTGSMGNSTDYGATWSTDHWNVTVSDFSIYASTAVARTAVAIPFIPTSSAIAITNVTIGGTAVSQGSAASTTNAWWWDSDQHALYVQPAAALGTSQTARTILTFSFTADTDLWATRVDDLATYNIGERQFYNGIMVANQYVYTTIFGGDVVWNGTHVNATGEQAELTGHKSGTGDVNLDCMERVAVHVDETVLPDSSDYYSANIKWAGEWQDWITEATNDHITMVFHNDTDPSTGWIQYLDNGISAARTQTYYAGKRYIKNDYQFTNNDTSAHSLPFIWMREQWLGTDRATNDRGRFSQSVADETTETSTPISLLSSPWWMNYDIGSLGAQGVIVPEAQTASATAYLLEHAPITTNVSPWAEWPVAVTYPAGTSPQSSDIVFTKLLGTIASGSSTSLTFWQWGSADLTTVTDIANAISADTSALNPPSTMAQAVYRLFNNTNSTDVGTALAAQNTAVTLGSAGATFRARMLANISGADLALNKQFKLQYVDKGAAGTCAAPTGTWTDVSASTPIAFNDNATPVNGNALTANANDPTDGSNTIMNQTYVEANPVSNTQSVVQIGQDGKWDFSLKDNSAPAGTTYCLRMIWNSGTLFGSYQNYPQVTMASSGTVSCSTSPSTTGFGTLTLSGVATASSNTTTTLSCTYGAGCTLYVSDAGSGSSAGLWASAVSHLIGSANSTLVAGTEGYGIQAATSSAGSGATLTLASAYNQTGNTVGGLLLSQTSLASSTASFTGREVVTTHKAAINGVTPAGSYADTITYSCVGN
ncbi:MAG: hypothetical protein WC246_00650 [Candidatus Paceibacterota bacterium]|jgi:hypothetical protein